MNQAMKPHRKLCQQKPELVQLIAERYVRASTAMSDWATVAKECVEMTEGKQWSAEDLRALAEAGRPAFKFNKLRPLVRLVLGYHRNNRFDLSFLPGHDGTGTDDVAKALTHLAKHTAELTQEQYVDGEVMMDGILTGRGFYDARLDYEQNDFGDLNIVAKDPFSIKLDPDAEEYDLNKGNFIIEDRWVSVDDVAFTYGDDAEALIAPLVHRSGYAGMPSSSIMEFMEQITPWRTFGGSFADDSPLLGMQHYMANAFDPYRKTIKLLDCQHYIRVWTRCFVDLETGQREMIPEQWNEARVQKVLDWAKYTYGKRGQVSPIRMQWRPMRRVRWTTLIGDIIVYDGWSPYETFSIVGYFPWFRRGQTQGMVEDLLDPQREVNKRRNANIDIVTRSAHSGWKYHKDSMSEEGKERLEVEGAAPGFNLEWQGDTAMEPKKIEPSTPPSGLERLEQRGADDLKEISGINDATLGIEEKVQSGRALEAKQRQGVITIQLYMDNNSRSKELLGRKKLEIYQNSYTEKRIISVLGDNGKLVTMTINQEAAAAITNDVTLGKYRTVIDETPLSASFLSAQFEELMMLIEKGILPKELVGDILVDISTIPRKEDIKKRIQAAMAQMGIQVDDEGVPIGPPAGMPSGAPGAPPPGALPPPSPDNAGSIVDAQGAPIQLDGSQPNVVTA